MSLKERARELRKQATDAEKLLWRHLRNRQLLGHKFRRQYPVDHYIADFVCLELQLIVELDGGQHAENRVYDDRRTRYLAGKGFQVIRFWNNEVLIETEAVLQALTLTLSHRERELGLRT